MSTRQIAYLVISIIATLLCPLTASANEEQPTLRATLSRDSLGVGEHFDLVIDIEKDRAAQIGIPRFGEELTAKERKALQARKAKMSAYEDYDEDIFELVEEGALDTISEQGRLLHLRKRYRLAVMETGSIPLRPAIINFERNREAPDTIYAPDTLWLHVAGYAELDTTLFLKADPTSQQGFGVDKELATSMLKDEGIFTQKNLPFIFAEIRDYVIYGAITTVLLALIAWGAVILLGRWIARRNARVKPIPKLPPHVVANKALVELSHRKLWQNGKFKEYYTALATILRIYISDRWGIGALEMTTDEIIAALREVDMSMPSRSDLVAVLCTADMVKFAKAEPAGEENEEAYTRSFYFVENTKLVEEEANEGKEDVTIETKIED